MSPSILPMDLNGMLAAMQSPPPPSQEQQPEPTAMSPATSAPQPQQGGGSTSVDPDTKALASELGVTTNTLQAMDPEHLMMAKDLSRLRKQYQQREAQQEAMLRELSSPDAIQKMANVGTKPSDFLKDALYNISQLNLRNPIYGSLHGQPYKPIQQQRLEDAINLHNRRVTDIQTMNSITRTLSQDTNDQFNQVAKVAQAKQAQLALESKERQSEAALQQKREASQLASQWHLAQIAVNSAKNATTAQAVEAKAEADRALAALRAKQAISGMTPWQYVGSMDIPDEQKIKLYAQLSLAGKPELGATTVGLNEAQMPDPRDPTKTISVYNHTYRTRIPAGMQGAVPQFIQPTQGSSVANPGSAAPPTPTQRINPKSIPTTDSYDKAVGAYNQINNALDTYMSVYKNVDRQAGNDLPGFLTGVQAWYSKHPDEEFKAATGRALAVTAGMPIQKANYIGDLVQAAEYVNLLREPSGATGFRGPQGWNALQSLVGSPMDDPEALKAKWRNVIRDILAIKAAKKKVIVSHDGGLWQPSKDDLDAYVTANDRGEDRNTVLENARRMTKRHYLGDTEK